MYTNALSLAFTSLSLSLSLSLAFTSLSRSLAFTSLSLSHLLLGAGREQRHRALGMLEVGQSHRDSCINAAGGHTQYWSLQRSSFFKFFAWWVTTDYVMNSDQFGLILA